MHDGATRRQRIGSGPGRAGDHQTVGPLAVDEFAVDGDFQVDQAARAAFAHHHIVERGAFEYQLAAAPDLSVQKDAFFCHVLAAENLGDGLEHVIDRDIGEKAQSPLIDADERYAIRRQFTCDRQHGAVAAQYHHDIAPGRQFMQIAGGEILDSEMFRRLTGEQDLMATRMEKRRQRTHRNAHALVVVFANQADRVKRGLHEGRLYRGMVSGEW